MKAIVICLLWFWPSLLWGCACCVESGIWQLQHYKLPDYETKQLSSLHLTQGYLVSPVIKGNKVTQSFKTAHLSGEFISPQKLVIISQQRQARQRLYFSFSTNVSQLLSDSNQPVKKYQILHKAYKELRLHGTISSTDKHLLNNKPAQLVLRGHGNQCFSQTDFSTWVLRIKLNKTQSLQIAGNIDIQLASNLYS